MPSITFSKEHYTLLQEKAKENNKSIEDFILSSVLGENNYSTPSKSQQKELADFLLSQHEIDLLFNTENYLSHSTLNLIENIDLLDEYLSINKALTLPVAEFKKFIKKNIHNIPFEKALVSCNCIPADYEKILLQIAGYDFAEKYFENLNTPSKNIDIFFKKISKSSLNRIFNEFHNNKQLQSNTYKNKLSNYKKLRDYAAKYVLSNPNVTIYPCFYKALSSVDINSLPAPLVDKTNILKLPVLCLEAISKNPTLPSDIKNAVFELQSIIPSDCTPEIQKSLYTYVVENFLDTSDEVKVSEKGETAKTYLNAIVNSKVIIPEIKRDLVNRFISDDKKDNFKNSVFEKLLSHKFDDKTFEMLFNHHGSTFKWKKLICSNPFNNTEEKYTFVNSILQKCIMGKLDFYAYEDIIIDAVKNGKISLENYETISDIICRSDRQPVFDYIILKAIEYKTLPPDIERHIKKFIKNPKTRLKFATEKYLDTHSGNPDINKQILSSIENLYRFSTDYFNINEYHNHLHNSNTSLPNISDIENFIETSGIVESLSLKIILDNSLHKIKHLQSVYSETPHNILKCEEAYKIYKEFCNTDTVGNTASLFSRLSGKLQKINSLSYVSEIKDFSFDDIENNVNNNAEIENIDIR